MAMIVDAPGFDTLSYARRLTQAEAVRDAITQGVATKADIARLEDKMATRTDVAKLETRIAELKVTLLLAIVGVGGVVVAAIALLP